MISQKIKTSSLIENARVQKLIIFVDRKIVHLIGQKIHFCHSIKGVSLFHNYVMNYYS
jgi:hypothetical protein